MVDPIFQNAWAEISSSPYANKEAGKISVKDKPRGKDKHLDQRTFVKLFKLKWTVHEKRCHECALEDFICADVICLDAP